MNITFARPNVGNLVFHLYGRSVHPELLSVFAATEVLHECYRATIQICEAGHVIAVQFKDQSVTEVTATQQQSLPTKKRLLERRLQGCRDASHRFDCGLHYRVSYQLEHLEPPVFQNFHEELLTDCACAELHHRFPSANRLEPEPVSVIRADAQSRELLVHTYHTFPENRAVIKTQSLFEF